MHYMRLSKLSSTFFFLSVLSACSSNSLLNHQIAIPPDEQEQMKTNTMRNDDSFTVVTNLQSFAFPSHEQLLAEAGFQEENQEQYDQSIKILTGFTSKTISSDERNQLAQNCNILVGNYSNEFPLNEKTLACAGYWLEQRYISSGGTLPSEKPHSGSGISTAKQAETPKHHKIILSEKQKQKWQSFKGMSFTDAFAQVNPDSYAQALTYMARALKFSPSNTKCAYVGAESALLVRLEAFLPAPTVIQNIDKLYKRVQACLLPNKDGTEKVNLRVGLLNLLSGEQKLAQTALAKTLLETNPKESSRSLFWLGALYQKSQPESKKSENPYWERLFKEVPLSYASIIASQQMGRDPMSNLVGDETLPVQNREKGGWTPRNLEAFIFELLQSKDETKTAAKNWATFINQTTTTINTAFILYWALAENSVGNYHDSLAMLGRYGKYIGNMQVSPTVLKFLYPVPVPYLSEILKNGKDIDPIFVLALMRQESAFDPYAHSSANARGLMQLLPSTAKRTIGRRLHPTELYDPKVNIDIGMSYLDNLLKKYNGQIEYVLASYNAGPLNVDDWRTRVPNENMFLFCDFMPFAETRSYVSIILRNYYWYKRIFTGQTDDPLLARVLEASGQMRFKSESVQALLYATTDNPDLDDSQKEILNRIYIFGNKQLNARNP